MIVAKTFVVSSILFFGISSLACHDIEGNYAFRCTVNKFSICEPDIGMAQMNLFRECVKEKKLSDCTAENISCELIRLQAKSFDSYQCSRLRVLLLESPTLIEQSVFDECGVAE